MKRFVLCLIALFASLVLSAYPYMIRVQSLSGGFAAGSVAICTSEYCYAPMEVIDEGVINLEGEIQQIIFFPMEGLIYVDYLRLEDGIVFFVEESI